MNLTVTAKQINEITNEKQFREELFSFLNEIIDEEIAKGDDMNTELIDECIDALDELQAQGKQKALKIVLTQKDIIKYCKKSAKVHSSKNAKAAVAACLVMLLGSTALFSADPALAQQTKEFFSNIISALSIAAEQSETDGETDIQSIYAVFPKDTSFTVKTESDIDLSKVTIKAVYGNGKEKTIPLRKCTVNKVKGTTAKNTILIVIAYEGCSLSITYTIEGR